MASAQDFERVWVHLLDDFMPGEPMSRSCGFVKENKADLGKGWKTLYKAFIKPMLSKGTSVIAVNDKDEIVGKQLISFWIERRVYLTYVKGMKIGRAVANTDKKDPALPTATMIKYFSKIMSKRWIKFMLMGDALKDVMHYNPHMVMEEQEIKKVFMGEILAVAESARGMRLGTALTLQSMELAKEKECEGYFAGLTGIYSQKIYRELDFSFEKELIYAEFKDKDGNIPFHDTLEHTSMKTAFKKL